MLQIGIRRLLARISAGDLDLGSLAQRAGFRRLREELDGRGQRVSVWAAMLDMDREVRDRFIGT